MKFSEPQKLQDGRYFVKVKTDFVQMNKTKLLTPFAEGDSVTLTVDGTVFSSIDEQIISAAKENSTQWFGREVQPKTIEAAYQKSTSGDSINLNKFKNIKAFDASRASIDPNELEADTECDCIIELVGLWFMKKTFGVHWRIVQIRKKKEPRKRIYETYLFTDEQDDSDDDDDDSL